MMTNEKFQIFIFHFAGGSRYSFNFLRPYIGPEFDVIMIELPGRGARMNEKLLYTRAAAADDVYRQVLKHRNGQPYVLFGHSMGAVMAYLITREFEMCNDFPIALIVSGNPGPNIQLLPKRYMLPREEFVEELNKLGGFTKELLLSVDLMNLFLPIIRADFEIAEKDEFSALEGEIMSPVYAIMGSGESFADRIDNWKLYTKGSYEARVFRGDHFFIYSYPEEIAAIIRNHFFSYKKV